MTWKERVLNAVWKTSMKKGGKIMVVATDRHVGIRADMKRNFPDFDHQRRKSVLISLSGSDLSQTTFGGVPKHVEETRRC